MPPKRLIPPPLNPRPTQQANRQITDEFGFPIIMTQETVPLMDALRQGVARVARSLQPITNAIEPGRPLPAPRLLPGQPQPRPPPRLLFPPVTFPTTPLAFLPFSPAEEALIAREKEVMNPPRGDIEELDWLDEPTITTQSPALESVETDSEAESQEEEEPFQMHPELPSLPLSLNMNGFVAEAQLHRQTAVIGSVDTPSTASVFNLREDHLIHYRVLDRPLLQPIHQFNAAVQFNPAHSTGLTTVNDVFAFDLHACLDISNMHHEMNGRFHTICAVLSSSLTAEVQDAVRNNTTARTEEELFLNSYMTTTAHFQVTTLHNSSFASLEISLNTRKHSLLRHAVSQGFLFLVYHVTTGALAGYPPQAVERLFDRFYIRVDSTRGRLVREGELNRVKFYKIRLGPYTIDHIIELAGSPQFAIRLETDYEEAVQNHMQAHPDSDGSDSDLPGAFSFQEATERRVERIVAIFLPRVAFERHRSLSVTTYNTAILRPGYETPHVINHDGDQEMGWKPLSKPTLRQLSVAQREADAIGCIVDHRQRLECAIKRLSCVWSPPNNNDHNCFFQCLLESLSSRQETLFDVKEARTLYGISHLLHLTDLDLERVATARNEVYHMYHIVPSPYHEKTLALQQDPSEARISHIVQIHRTIAPTVTSDTQQHHYFLSHKQHCYLLKNVEMLTKKVKCGTCGQWLNRANFHSHIECCCYCAQCRKVYNPKVAHECNPEERRVTPRERRVIEARRNDTPEVCTNWLAMESSKKGKKLSPDTSIWLADLEAFPSEEDDHFVTYAIGITCLEDYRHLDKIRIFWGENCFSEYFDFLATISGTLYYYNGSGFDNFLHLRAMVDEGLEIRASNFVRKAGRIMAFDHHAQLKVHDLCLFIQNSLERGAISWGVPEDMVKKGFNHDKIFSWESANLHRAEVTEYLRYDVICLAHLFHIYYITMWECFSMDINKCISPAQYAIKVWCADNPYIKEIYIPHRGKEEEDDRAAYYGGRVMCQYKQYQSLDWVDTRTQYDYADIDDYLVLGDVNSLYPAAQFQNRYAHGKWQYIEGSEEHVTRLNLLSLEEDDILRSCFCVDVSCPTDLLTSFLMERNAKGEITHSLLPKVKQWYWGCELREAIILGYRVSRVYEIKQFERLSPLFHGM